MKHDQELTKDRIQDKKTFDIVKKMKSIWKFIKKKLANAQKFQKKYADRKKFISSEYIVEDEVWLSIKNIKTKQSSRKLNHKWIELYRIKKILKNVCQLDLSRLMKIHDIFHTFLLRKVATNLLIKQIQSSSSSIMMNDEEEYEMNDILNSRYHYEKLQHRIVWIDHFSNRAWYSAKNFKHFKNILKDYHQRYSTKFESKLRLMIIIDAMLSQWIWNEYKKAKQFVQNVLNKMKTKMKKNTRMRLKENSLINTFDRH
jgi:hypothetical protein